MLDVIGAGAGVVESVSPSGPVLTVLVTKPDCVVSSVDTILVVSGVRSGLAVSGVENIALGETITVVVVVCVGSKTIEVMSEIFSVVGNTLGGMFTLLTR